MVTAFLLYAGLGCFIFYMIWGPKPETPGSSPKPATLGLPPFCVPVAMTVGSTVTVVSSGRRRLCGVGPRTPLPELRWRPIPQRTVRPDLVVFPLPLPPQHARFQHAPKLFSLQKLVPQLAVERLRIPVLPRRPRLDVQRLDLRRRQPR